MNGIYLLGYLLVFITTVQVIAHLHLRHLSREPRELMFIIIHHLLALSRWPLFLMETVWGKDKKLAQKALLAWLTGMFIFGAISAMETDLYAVDHSSIHGDTARHVGPADNNSGLVCLRYGYCRRWDSPTKPAILSRLPSLNPSR